MEGDYVLVLARWMHFSAAMVLFGSSLFQFYMGDLGQIAWSPPRSFTVWFGALALLGAGLWLYRYAAAIGEPDETATTVWVILSETSFGIVWAVRIAASLVLMAVAMLAPDRAWTGLVAALAATLLIAEGWDGHVVGAASLGPLNQAVHLLAAGAWLGSLVPLASIISRARHHTAADNPARGLGRYSNLALGAVLLVATTGTANTWLVLGGAPSASAPYGRALILKISLFGVMLLLAALNRLVIMPRLTNAVTRVNALGHLSTTILLEQVLGAAILLDVSLFGLMDPAS